MEIVKCGIPGKSKARKRRVADKLIKIDFLKSQQHASVSFLWSQIQRTSCKAPHPHLLGQIQANAQDEHQKEMK